MERFDEIHVVSDLHLGGVTGQQIFAGSELLAGLLDKLSQRRRHIAFVINGDFVDFLAEPGATYFDPDGASGKLSRIGRDPSFLPIWEALRRFVAREGCVLVIVLGNHDLELALPRVQEALLDSLCAGSEAARGRIRLCTAGTGFSALVGNRRVLCLHGNECDDFNRTDHETLRRAACKQSYGFPVDAWVPNAGTKLVIELMNGIKRDLPFVDLLKPETDAVVPLLVAMGQSSLQRLAGVFEVAARTATDAIRHQLGFLSLPEAGPAPASDPVQAREGTPTATMRQTALRYQMATLAVLGTPEGTATVRGHAHDEFRVRLLDATEARFVEGQDPLALDPAEANDTLGLGNLIGASGRAILAAISGRSKPEVVRTALKHLLQDRSFQLADRDPTFKSIDSLVPADVGVVITGHTHLERRIHRGGGSEYINTGTWARLIELSPDKLKEKAFTEVFTALQSKTMAELVNASPSVVTHKPAMASVEALPDKTAVELRRIAGSAADVTLEEVKP